MSAGTLRLVALLSVLGVIPGIVFALDRTAPIVALSTASVLLIAWSLSKMLDSETPDSGVVHG